MAMRGPVKVGDTAIITKRLGTPQIVRVERVTKTMFFAGKYRWRLKDHWLVGVDSVWAGIHIHVNPTQALLQEAALQILIEKLDTAASILCKKLREVPEEANREKLQQAVDLLAEMIDGE